MMTMRAIYRQMLVAGKAGTDLIDSEVVVAEGIVVQEDVRHVADDFACKSSDHDWHAAPCLVSKAEDDGDNQVDSHDGGSFLLSKECIEKCARFGSQVNIEEKGSWHSKMVDVSIPGKLLLFLFTLVRHRWA